MKGVPNRSGTPDTYTHRHTTYPRTHTYTHKQNIYEGTLFMSWSGSPVITQTGAVSIKANKLC